MAVTYVCVMVTPQSLCLVPVVLMLLRVPRQSLKIPALNCVAPSKTDPAPTHLSHPANCTMTPLVSFAFNKGQGILDQFPSFMCCTQRQQILLADPQSDHLSLPQHIHPNLTTTRRSPNRPSV